MEPGPGIGDVIGAPLPAQLLRGHVDQVRPQDVERASHALANIDGFRLDAEPADGLGQGLLQGAEDLGKLGGIPDDRKEPVRSGLVLELGKFVIDVAEQGGDLCERHNGR